MKVFSDASRSTGGCTLTGGSDAPVEPVFPLLAIAEAMRNALEVATNDEATVRRRYSNIVKPRSEPARVVEKCESLSFRDALAMFTTNAAYGSFAENRLGKLSRLLQHGEA